MNPVTSQQRKSPYQGYGQQNPYAGGGQSMAYGQPHTNAYSNEPAGYSSAPSSSNDMGTTAASGAAPSSSSAVVIPAVGSVLSGVFYENPADEAMEYTSQMEEMLTKYLGSYMEHGKNAGDALFREFMMLLNNPQGQYDELTAGFEESPGYEYNYNQSMNASNSAAAAGGMLGSPAHQQAASEQATQNANQEFSNYFDDMLNLYMTGIGMGQDFYKTGYGASSQMADTMAQNLWKEAQLAALGTMGRNSKQGNILGGVVGIVPSAWDEVTSWF